MLYRLRITCCYEKKDKASSFRKKYFLYWRIEIIYNVPELIPDYDLAKEKTLAGLKMYFNFQKED